MEDLKQYFNRILTNASRAKARREFSGAVAERERVRKGFHRIPSIGEANKPVLPVLYHYVFCSHNRPYWEQCTKCGRDSVLARRNGEMILAKLPKELVDALAK